MTKPAWYGGNKIPLSYLAKFMPKTKQDETLPYELRMFLDGMGGEKRSKRDDAVSRFT
jgi:hypothetical protein